MVHGNAHYIKAMLIQQVYEVQAWGNQYSLISHTDKPFYISVIHVISIGNWDLIDLFLVQGHGVQLSLTPRNMP